MDVGLQIRSIGEVEGWGPLKRSKEKVHEGGPRRKPEKRTNDFFLYIWKFFICLILYAQWHPLFAFNSGVEYYIRKVFIVLFFHFFS